MKSRAQKPILKKINYLKYGFVIMQHEDCLCPRCGAVLNAGPDYCPRYCSWCGQKLDFTGIKWTGDRQLGFAEGRGIL